MIYSLITDKFSLSKPLLCRRGHHISHYDTIVFLNALWPLLTFLCVCVCVCAGTHCLFSALLHFFVLFFFFYLFILIKNICYCLCLISDLPCNFCVFSASTSSFLTLRSATTSWEFGMVHLGHQTGGSCWKNGQAQPYLKTSTRLSTYSRCSLILIISSASKDFLYSSPVSRPIAK